MKVYVLIEGTQYEKSTVVKVFSSKSTATEYMGHMEVMEDMEKNNYYYEVEEYDLVGES